MGNPSANNFMFVGFFYGITNSKNKIIFLDKLKPFHSVIVAYSKQVEKRQRQRKSETEKKETETEKKETETETEEHRDRDK
jgi:hypothetical protein